MLRYSHGGGAYVYVINFQMHSLNLLLQFVIFNDTFPTLNLFLLNLIFTFTTLRSTSVTTSLNHFRSSCKLFTSSCSSSSRSLTSTAFPISLIWSSTYCFLFSALFHFCDGGRVNSSLSSPDFKKVFFCEKETY